MALHLLEVNLERVFEYGQAYVALSRAVSLDRLRVMGLKPESVRAHPRVLEFYRSLQRGSGIGAAPPVEAAAAAASAFPPPQPARAAGGHSSSSLRGGHGGGAAALAHSHHPRPPPASSAAVSSASSSAAAVAANSAAGHKEMNALLGEGFDLDDFFS